MVVVSVFTQNLREDGAYFIHILRFHSVFGHNIDVVFYLMCSERSITSLRDCVTLPSIPSSVCVRSFGSEF